MGNNVIWIEPPEALEAAMVAYGTKALTAVRAVADFIALKVQNEARVNAPWEDRSKAARGGLFGVVTQEAAEAAVTIYLSHGHTVFYGKFLELSNGQRYAIIMPTIQRNLPVIEKMLKNIFD